VARNIARRVAADVLSGLLNIQQGELISTKTLAHPADESHLHEMG